MRKGWGAMEPMALVLILLLLPGLSWAFGSASPAPDPAPPLFSFFKSIISSTDGDRCSHLPSCSRYAREAVSAHGVIKGALLSCDRLIRCGGDDTKRLPQVMVEGKRYVWDPVSANDFWWKKEANASSLPAHFKGWE